MDHRDVLTRMQTLPGTALQDNDAILYSRDPIPHPTSRFNFYDDPSSLPLLSVYDKVTGSEGIVPFGLGKVYKLRKFDSDQRITKPDHSADDPFVELLARFDNP